MPRSRFPDEPAASNLPLRRPSKHPVWVDEDSCVRRPIRDSCLERQERHNPNQCPHLNRLREWENSEEKPRPVWGGAGVGVPCSVSGVPIRKEEMELEVHFARAGNTPP